MMRARARGRRGFILLMLSWSIAALALLMQVLAVRGVTGLRITQWQQQELQARQAAEAGLDAIISFYKTTQNQTCFDYQQPNFNQAGTPVSCANALSSHILTGKTNLRFALGLNGLDYNLMVQYKIVDVSTVAGTKTKNITVKAYRDWGSDLTTPSPTAKAIVQMGAQITLNRQISRGLVGIGTVHIGMFGDIGSDVSTTSGAINAVNIDKNVWIRGHVKLGPVSQALLDGPLSGWVGTRMDTHVLVMGQGSAIMDNDPQGQDLVWRMNSIDAYHGGDTTYKYILSAPDMTILDTSHIEISHTPTPMYDTGNVLSEEFEAITEELSQPPDVSTAGMACTLDMATADAEIKYISKSALYGYDATRDAFCFKSLSTGSHGAKLVITTDTDEPVTVYIKDRVPMTNYAMRIGDGSTVMAQHGIAQVTDGVHIKIANNAPATNTVWFMDNAIIHGTLYAPTSLVHFGDFDSVDGIAVLAKDLDIGKMANGGPNLEAASATAFRVTAVHSWIDRPDPQAN